MSSIRGFLSFNLDPAAMYSHKQSNGSAAAVADPSCHRSGQRKNQGRCVQVLGIKSISVAINLG